jgi:hypothetical protein
LIELRQRIAFAIGAVEKNERIESDERKASRLFISLRRFKKKTRLPIVDLGKSGDRRLDIRDQIDNQRNEIAALGQVAEFLT